jgi:putative transposase
MEVEDFIERAIRERRSLQDALGDMLSKYNSIPSGKERSVLARIPPGLGFQPSGQFTHRCFCLFAYDNALAETINGLYKAEVIHRRGPWRSFEAVEFATLEWVDWFNNRRLLEPIGNLPPAEAEAAYYAQLEVTGIAA